MNITLDEEAGKIFDDIRGTDPSISDSETMNRIIKNALNTHKIYPHLPWGSYIDYNAYTSNDCNWTEGTVPESSINGKRDIYTGPYAVFTLVSPYSEQGKLSFIQAECELFVYQENQWVKVIKVDKSTPYAHQVYVISKSANLPKIIKNSPMLVSLSACISGYFDSSSKLPMQPPMDLTRVERNAQECDATDAK